MHRHTRMKKELQMLKDSPPPGIACWPKGDSIENLEAQIIGGSGTPYEGGVFKLSIHLPERYPFEPPKVNFSTPIYHPNIDAAGRICLNVLKLPPNGGWKPCLNISTVLTSILVLMNDPNPDDPLMADIAEEFKYKKSEFLLKAASYTKKHASGNSATVVNVLTVQDNGAETTGTGTQLGKRPLVHEQRKSTGKCPRNENTNS
ncbi:ubiquitin-conjugating enzyme E2 T [Octopus sinensis]|uniref:Ubiquitin-conjugating enzyme E2 T n=1 Tax=Octopus sinensis TaxID=2607531 RepID=A0A6P7TLY2_9MOLL|nr:ubiquitin-conjugating enzyme E2 T [Octopus sinensis]